MAELQTVAAIFDLLKLTYEVGKFLKKVKDADKIAGELSERIKRLENVLQGVQAAVRDHEISPGHNAEAAVAETISGSVLACTQTICQLQKRLGGFDTRGKKSIPDRFKIALREPSIGRINDELEARVHILSTELAVLQLFAQTRAGDAVKQNHNELLQAIDRLGIEVEEGNKIQKQMIERALKDGCQPSSSPGVLDFEAIDTLSQCLRGAEDIHEQFSSEYFPDSGSQRMKRAVAQGSESPFAISTSPPAIATPSIKETVFPLTSGSSAEDSRTWLSPDMLDEGEDEDEDVWPLDMLNRHIKAYSEQAAEHRDSLQWIQAESSLHHAVRNSETRESHYGVPFAERAQMQEEMAFLLQKQRKWSESISTVHQLLRERSSPVVSAAPEAGLAQARQHYLLASIYYDRYTSNAAASSTQSADDIERAENHAMKAFNRFWKTLNKEHRADVEFDQQNDCIELFARILDTRDKTVEASGLRKLLAEQPASSAASDSMRRVSTHTRPHVDYDLIDKHDILAEAIKSGDTEQIHNLLATKDLNLERIDKHGKTFLMHAVERSDESTVHFLLGAENQADVNATNRRGLTALHLAAEKGLVDMTRCLLTHDADVEPRDKYGETPLTKAVVAGHIAMVEVFFQWDESTINTKGSEEWSLLHYASQKSGKEMIDLVLDLNPDLKDAVDRAGKTALHHCAEHDGRLEQAAALVENPAYSEADVNATDSCSRNALYFAASRPPTQNREAMVQLLLSKGARIDEQKPPPRMRDYVALKKSLPRRDSMASRTSVSTEGTCGTTSTSASRFSRAIGRLGIR